MTPLLLALLSTPPSLAADATSPAPAEFHADSLDLSSHARKKKKKGGFKGPEDRLRYKRYNSGLAIASLGMAASTGGLVVLGMGGLKAANGPPGAGIEWSSLNLSAGLLSIGGLVGSSGALGAAIAVDNGTKRSSPVIAGALGLTLGIFAPTFFGVGAGLQMEAFAWTAISTGFAATGLTLIQVVQSSGDTPKRWTALHVDPVSRRAYLTMAF